MDSLDIYFAFRVGDVLWYVSFYRQIVKTTNFCLSDQNGILLYLVFSDLGDVVNRRQGVVSCLLGFDSLSSDVETLLSELHVLQCLTRYFQMTRQNT
jgi:hypothetical protein